MMRCNPLRFLATVVGAALSMSVMLGVQAADQTVQVRITAAVPPDTSGDVFLAGSVPALGPWNPTGLKMSRNADGTYSAEFAAPAATTLEFKLTRGSWASVEKTLTGGEVANRTIALPASGTVNASVTVDRWADPTTAAARPSTVTGKVVLHERFESKLLGNARTIRVWLPPGYDSNEADRFPVLYMHDGQNAFDAATSAFGNEWQADEAATKLITTGEIKPVIIVGIDSGPARIIELTHTKDARMNIGGMGKSYARFVVEELKPFIDSTYRTQPGRESTMVVGSSLGGLVSLYIAIDHPTTFSAAAVVSPALWWDDRRALRDLEDGSLPPANTRFWIDMGTAEGNPAQSKAFADDARRLAEALRKAGCTDVSLSIADGGTHSETAWQKRFPEILKFLLSR